MKNMMFTKYYTVRPEYADLWGEDCHENTLVSEETVADLSSEWEKPLEELLSQLEEATVYNIDGTNYIVVGDYTTAGAGVNAIKADEPSDDNGAVDLYELTDIVFDGPTVATKTNYGWLLRERRVI